MDSCSCAPSNPPRYVGGSHETTPVMQLLNTGEVSVALRVSKMTVYRLIRDGRLAATRVGNSLRVCRDDLDGYLVGACIPPMGSGPGAWADGSMSSPPGV